MAPKRSLSTEDVPPSKKARVLHSSRAGLETKAQPQGGQNDTLSQVAIPSHSQEWQQRVHDLAQRNPRYLFRAWHSMSGGHEGLNNETAITPLAFLKGDRRDLLYDIPRQELASIATAHLRYHPQIRTFFSSWSQSLAFVLLYASNMPSGTAHISVIDVHRLSGKNIVLYTPQMHVISREIPPFANEFLAFGVISGDAHKAVALRDVEASGFGRINAPWQSVGLPVHYHARTWNPRSRMVALKQASTVGRLFGERFALPVTVYLLSFRYDDIEANEEAFKLLMAMGVVDDFVAHSPGPSTSRFATDYIDVERAIRLLQSLVKARSSVSSDMEDVDMRDVDRADEVRKNGAQVADEGEDEPTNIKRTIIESDRVPKMVKELYIDMIGWN